MIISRTPFRISFFGGGTDYPAWFTKHGGAVLSTSFDKYSYITCRHLPPFFDHKYRIAYSQLEHVNAIADIRHPAVRAVLNELDDGQGLEIHCDADLPARSGLGSSSAFLVGLLHALHGLRGRRVSQRWLAQEAIRFEQQVLAEHVGSQDQIAAACGGFNIIHFRKDGGFCIEPVVLPDGRREELERHLMLFFTGFSRIASQVAKSQIENLDRNTQEVHRIRAMVDQGADLLASNHDISEFGALLHSAWMHKRGLSDRISTAEVDTIYDTARLSGAIGGKLLGAGGGGFMLLFVPPERQADVRSALKQLIHVPFRFENEGSQIAYYRESFSGSRT
jgi:D-glycero-alpha-D-manno-heptose-7-phosphate kinase